MHIILQFYLETLAKLWFAMDKNGNFGFLNEKNNCIFWIILFIYS